MTPSGIQLNSRCGMIGKNKFSKTVCISSKHFDDNKIGMGKDLVLIAGPCAIESRDHSMRLAESIGKICRKLGIRWIFKACYDKDCRSSPNSFHGVGLEEGLRILTDVRETHAVPVTSDFSDPSWGKATGEVCDMVQVPAYLCRQTSMLRAAAETGKPVHLKRAVYEPLEYEKFLP